MDFIDGDFFSAKRKQLLKQRLAIAHRTVGTAGQQRQRLLIGLDAFVLRDLTQAIGDLVCLDWRKIKSLTAREDRDRNFLWVGRAKNKLHMQRRFLKRLKQSVERLRREHVDFVDDVNLVFRTTGSNGGVGTKLTNLVDAAIGSTINLEHIDVFAGRYRLANITLITRRHRWALFAIQALGENPGRRSLADSSRTGKQVSVPDTVFVDRIGKRRCNMALPDKVPKRLRTVSQRDNLILSVWIGLFRIHLNLRIRGLL